MSNRRSFIKTLGLSGLGTAVAPDLFAFPHIKSEPVFVILGAGLAGLSAAYTLHKAGIPSVVLEARNRYGGRVFTHTLKTGGLRVELGAEWIGNGHHAIKDLCLQELGLTLKNNQVRADLILQGQYRKTDPAAGIFSPEWTAKLEQIYRTFAAERNPELERRLDGYDWHTYLKEKGCTPADLWLHELNDSTDFGEGLRHVPALVALAEYVENYGEIQTSNQMDLKVEGGNLAIARALLQQMGNNCSLELNKKILAVRQEGAGYRVYCNDSSIYAATHIICTLPAPAVLNIQWEPQLSVAKTDALRSLQYARIRKHAFAFGTSFWDEEFSALCDTDSHYIYHATRMQNNAAGALISYATGDKADLLHNQHSGQVRNGFLQSIRPAFGNKERALTEDVNYYWGADPYTGGAYAQFHKGQWSGIRSIMAGKENNIWFAGEHLAEWQGFMEGAVQTGMDAVADALEG